MVNDAKNKNILLTGDTFFSFYFTTTIEKFGVWGN